MPGHGEGGASVAGQRQQGAVERRSERCRGRQEGDPPVAEGDGIVVAREGVSVRGGAGDGQNQR